MPLLVSAVDRSQESGILEGCVGLRLTLVVLVCCAVGAVVFVGCWVSVIVALGRVPRSPCGSNSDVSSSWWSLPVGLDVDDEWLQPLFNGACHSDCRCDVRAVLCCVVAASS